MPYSLLDHGTLQKSRQCKLRSGYVEQIIEYSGAQVAM